MQWATRHMAVGRGNEKGVFDNLPWASWASEGARKQRGACSGLGLF